jgi:uncharacterized protein with HEPN domain
VSSRSWKGRVQDILICAKNIQDFTRSMNLDTFLNDPKTIRAVAFELTTIGEAARFIPMDIQEQYPEIPWAKMQGIRNVLIHEYFRVDEEILWETSQHDIPQLITMLEKVLKNN